MFCVSSNTAQNKFIWWDVNDKIRHEFWFFLPVIRNPIFGNWRKGLIWQVKHACNKDRQQFLNIWPFKPSIQWRHLPFSVCSVPEFHESRPCCVPDKSSSNIHTCFPPENWLSYCGFPAGNGQRTKTRQSALIDPQVYQLGKHFMTSLPELQDSQVEVFSLHYVMKVTTIIMITAFFSLLISKAQNSITK